MTKELYSVKRLGASFFKEGDEVRSEEDVHEGFDIVLENNDKELVDGDLDHSIQTIIINNDSKKIGVQIQLNPDGSMLVFPYAEEDSENNVLMSAGEEEGVGRYLVIAAVPEEKEENSETEG